MLILYRLVQKKETVLLSTSLAWPAVAGCSRAETFSQLTSIYFAQPCTIFAKTETHNAAEHLSRPFTEPFLTDSVFPTFQRPSHIFIASLASTDLLLGITVMVPRLVHELAGSWIFGFLLCQVTRFSLKTPLSLSLSLTHHTLSASDAAKGQFTGFIF